MVFLAVPWTTFSLSLYAEFVTKRKKPVVKHKRRQQENTSNHQVVPAWGRSLPPSCWYDLKCLYASLLALMSYIWLKKCKETTC